MRLSRLAAILAIAICTAAAPPARVDDLAWLSGHWLSETKSGWTEEMWTDARGGVMLGTNRSGKADRSTGFEFMRIAADGEGRVAFWASPGGAAAVAFPLVSSRAGEAVFENPKNDYPTRIVYRREGNRLVATINGPGGKNPMRRVFRRR